MAPFEPLTRPRYFAGQVLSADDLRDEQEYFIARLRRRNRFMHGWGVVSGLHVSVSGGGTVVVGPGIAIDCFGNEIVLAASTELAIVSPVDRIYVAVRYVEELTGEVPTLDGVQSSRVRESAVVELAETNPNAGHGGMASGTPGCGTAHALGIATLGRRNARWRVVSHHRRR